MATTAVVSSMSPVQPSRPNVIFRARIRSACAFAPAASSLCIDSVTIKRSDNAVTLHISARAKGLSKNSSSRNVHLELSTAARFWPMFKQCSTEWRTGQGYSVLPSPSVRRLQRPPLPRHQNQYCLSDVIMTNRRWEPQRKGLRRCRTMRSVPPWLP